ncbi:MAG TPA: hypothetical protein VLJ37_08720 [bacterium]|nr:hypothetical protein [bacterium]
MSGLTCGDRGQENLGDSLCKSPDDHPDPNQRGLVTYRDGRVAAVIRSEGGNTVFAGPKGTGEITVADLGTAAITLMRTMAGGEIGDCAARDKGGLSFSALQNVYNGSPITWSQSHLAVLYRALGQSTGQSGNAFFCSNRENAGGMVVNNDTFHRPALLAAINALAENRGKFPELDDDHHGAMLQSLRAAAGVPESQSPWDQIKGVMGYLFGGLFVFIVGGAGSHFLTEWLKKFGGPKDPPGGDAKKPGGDVSRKPEPATPVAKREGGPDLGAVISGSLLGVGGLVFAKALSVVGRAPAAPGLVPQGALGSGPIIVPKIKSENGCERWPWEDEKKCGGGA